MMDIKRFLVIKKWWHLLRGEYCFFYLLFTKNKYFFIKKTHSGPVLALVLKGEDVVRGWLEMIGPDDPEKAKQESPARQETLKFF
jgi:nucleoside diphosphate kinase